ncbi:hypothetical protein Pmani_018702 [Petrolisthes manimaculis]|uniref:Coiled-coil domain-containing protein 85C n=1 Tax=Petrolisthes manimaculis TaxID=1843537 RepID=A0AAE1PJW1_9EUCA|nr:hypothetical protein Pmani_018702 [Petrolisthes manimaculis]
MAVFQESEGCWVLMPAAAHPHIPPMAPPPPHQGKSGPPRPPPHHPPPPLALYPGSGPQRGPPQAPPPLQNGPTGHRAPPLQPPGQRGAPGPIRPLGVAQYPHPSPPQPPAYPEPPRYPGPLSGQGEEGEQSREGGPGTGVGSGLEEEIKGLSRGELVNRVLRGEAEARDLRQSCLNHTSELRHLRHAHTRLTDDNQELRDLCCFLDDDRQKGRKLAREWQRFGRYTASVMRQEVTAYQNKLRQLEAKQQELIKDNLELKELCLYLDEERSNAACGHCGNPLITRDDGDGSSSSTNADEPSGPPHHPPHLPPPPPPPAPPSQHSTTTTGTNNTLARSPSRERLLEDTLNRQRSPMNEQVVAYIRSLEARVMLLEAERQQITKPDRSHPEGQGGDNANIPPTSGHHPAFPSLNQNPGTNPMDSKSRPPHPPPYSLSHHLRAVGLGLTRAPLGPGSAESDDDLLDGPPPLVSRPNSVAAAMRVLEVQEQLEAPPQPPPAPPPPPSAGAGGRQDAGLADGEKALLRQMCSVVWKKLEEVPTQNR